MTASFFTLLIFLSCYCSLTESYNAPLSKYVDICDGDATSRIHKFPVYLKSPNFPKKYPNDQECTFSLDITNYTDVMVTTEVVKIEKDGRCSKDFLYIVTYGELCKKEKQPILVNRDKLKDLVIVFGSNRKTTDKGFLLTVTATKRLTTTKSNYITTAPSSTTSPRTYTRPSSTTLIHITPISNNNTSKQSHSTTQNRIISTANTSPLTTFSASSDSVGAEDEPLSDAQKDVAEERITTNTSAGADNSIADAESKLTSRTPHTTTTAMTTNTWRTMVTSRGVMTTARFTAVIHTGLTEIAEYSTTSTTSRTSTPIVANVVSTTVKVPAVTKLPSDTTTAYIFSAGIGSPGRGTAGATVAASISTPSTTTIEAASTSSELPFTSAEVSTTTDTKAASASGKLPSTSRETSTAIFSNTEMTPTKKVILSKTEVTASKSDTTADVISTTYKTLTSKESNLASSTQAHTTSTAEGVDLKLTTATQSLSTLILPSQDIMSDARLGVSIETNETIDTGNGITLHKTSVTSMTSLTNILTTPNPPKNAKQSDIPSSTTSLLSTLEFSQPTTTSFWMGYESEQTSQRSPGPLTSQGIRSTYSMSSAVTVALWNDMTTKVPPNSRGTWLLSEISSTTVAPTSNEFVPGDGNLQQLRSVSVGAANSLLQQTSSSSMAFGSESITEQAVTEATSNVRSGILWYYWFGGGVAAFIVIICVVFLIVRLNQRKKKKRKAHDREPIELDFQEHMAKVRRMMTWRDSSV